MGYSQFDRCWQLKNILASGEIHTLDEYAMMFGVTPRTIQNDLYALYPIIPTRGIKGGHGHIEVEEFSKYRNTLTMQEYTYLIHKQEEGNANDIIIASRLITKYGPYKKS